MIRKQKVFVGAVLCRNKKTVFLYNKKNRRKRRMKVEILKPFYSFTNKTITSSHRSHKITLQSINHTTIIPKSIELRSICLDCPGDSKEVHGNVDLETIWSLYSHEQKLIHLDHWNPCILSSLPLIMKYNWLCSQLIQQLLNLILKVVIGLAGLMHCGWIWV